MAEYLIDAALALAAIAVLLATPFLLNHSRGTHDHGTACWWCHPRIPRMRRR
ncbi:hypothetical protein [Streptomyces klenkii]|uniref:hypothetical protein n=1 Tax=Streptomyces klenkii TaxID=1420899 RepID=UPI0018F4B2FC|nr:hypothetical protein [Streptomyces klenkii]